MIAFKFNPEDCLILVVDDASKNLQLVIEILDNEGYATTFASSGKQAIERVKKADPDLILLDLMMPEMGGIEVCQILKRDPRYREIPIIFLTANNDKENIVRAFDSGAVDYVTKPFYSNELLARVKTHLELKKTRDELKKAKSQLEESIVTDYLTGVPNRRAIFTFGQKEFQRVARYSRSFSVLVIDIDYFKKVNDTFGHAAGDETLISVARAIRDCLRNVDGFGRWGGEEFVAILPETTIENALCTAKRICQAIGGLKISIGDREISVTLSIGVAGYQKEDTHLETVIERADLALLAAKNQGRARVVANI
ncbi:diguanylate cyclase [Pannus brasiliensis CCIBt3594]|uniref:Diguanylate cyclase n=1 Tax=Pannus brasiliensis CCIBt3594 TaxID=1427578 RepID=A0AAW9QLM1_9CHRO